MKQNWPECIEVKHWKVVSPSQFLKSDQTICFGRDSVFGQRIFQHPSCVYLLHKIKRFHDFVMVALSSILKDSKCVWKLTMFLNNICNGIFLKIQSTFVKIVFYIYLLFTRGIHCICTEDYTKQLKNYHKCRNLEYFNLLTPLLNKNKLFNVNLNIIYIEYIGAMNADKQQQKKKKVTDS